jgi:hypothetical protein
VVTASLAIVISTESTFELLDMCAAVSVDRLVGQYGIRQLA